MIRSNKLAIWLQFIRAVYPDVYNKIPTHTLKVMQGVTLQPQYTQYIGKKIEKTLTSNENSKITYCYMPLQDYLELSYVDTTNERVDYCFQPSVIQKRLREIQREKVN